jgi:hypothetical protein
VRDIAEEVRLRCLPADDEEEEEEEVGGTSGGVSRRMSLSVVEMWKWMPFVGCGFGCVCGFERMWDARVDFPVPCNNYLILAYSIVS